MEEIVKLFLKQSNAEETLKETRTWVLKVSHAYQNYRYSGKKCPPNNFSLANQVMSRYYCCYNRK